MQVKPINKNKMRPPICAVCYKRFSPRKEPPSGLIHFKLTEEEKEYNNEMLKLNKKGHPKGKEWFCEEHYLIAKKHQELTRSEALAILRKEFPQNNTKKGISKK